MNTAKRVCTWRGRRPDGDAAVYELSEPVQFEDGDATKYVVVSAIPNVMGGGRFDTGPETYIFPAKKINGGGFDIADWGELEGSYQGGMDHAEALSGLGYEVTE